MTDSVQCKAIARAYKTLLEARKRAWKVYCKALEKAENDGREIVAKQSSERGKERRGRHGNLSDKERYALQEKEFNKQAGKDVHKELADKARSKNEE